MKKYAQRLVFGLIGIVILFVGILYAFVEFTPFNTAKLDAKSPATEVMAKDGSVYMTIGGQGTTNLAYSQISPNLVNALVSTEEHGYWSNSSIDFKSVLRSMTVDLVSHRYAQGFSTIEMQVAKIVFLNDKKTLTRKFQQVVLGMQINRYYTKQEIVAMYLNKVYFGEGANGVEQAALRYFGVDIATNKNGLTLPQAALLAGLPQAPSGYDPFVNPKAAMARRNIVLDNMAKYHYITQAQAATAKAAPLGASRHQLSGDAWDTHPLFTNFLFDNASKQGISPEEIMQGGLKIYTTLDPKVQSAIDTVFWSHNYNGHFPSFSKTTVLQSGALFVDPKTGGILGGAGSREDGFVPGGLDRIYSMSPPGSSIKPVMDYAPAIESGKFGPSSILDNTPHDFGGGYVPQNYDRGSAPAKCSLSYALQTSQNVASVYLLQQIGLSTGTSFAENDGIPLNNANRNQLGIAIGGNLDVSPYIMAQAYEAFDNQGVQMQVHLITKILNQQGDTTYSYQSAAKRIMSPQTAAVMTNLLQNVVNQGTGVNAQVPGWQVAGKTGTVQYSSGVSDVHSNWLSRVWFDGYTGNMVGSIYLGYDETNSAHHLIDFPDPVANCASVFSDVVTLAEQGVAPVPLNSTAGVTPVQPQNVPIANLGAEYTKGLNSVTLHWTSKVTNQQLSFVVSKTVVSLPDQSGTGNSGTTTDNPPGTQTPGNVGGTQNAQNPNIGSPQILGRTSGSSFTDVNVQPGVVYMYSVQPVDATTMQPVGQPVTCNVTIPGYTQGNTLGNGQNATDGNSTSGTGTNGSNSTNNTSGNDAVQNTTSTLSNSVNVGIGTTPSGKNKGKHH